mgnify:FL=1
MHTCDINNCFLANNLMNSLYFLTKEELIKNKIDINNSSHIGKHTNISHIIPLKLDKIPIIQYNRIKTYDYDNIKLLLNIKKK